MKSPFFVVGPTAVGKTEIAAEIAAGCGGEVVSADAFQIYAGLDLLTAKPSAATLRRAPHHMIGCVSLQTSYSVADYLAQARECLSQIAARGRPAIIVGGSGLYVKALTHGLSPLPPAQPELRASLEAQDRAALFARLSALDPPLAATIDRQNKRRLVRALEVCIATGGRFSDLRGAWSEPGAGTPPEACGVFLSRERSELYARIDRRVDAIFRAGVLEEVRRVPAADIGPTASGILGLAAIRAHLRGDITLETCREGIKTATRRYAKRQHTWFKRESVLRPLLVSPADDPAEIAAGLLGDMRRLTPTGPAITLPPRD